MKDVTVNDVFRLADLMRTRMIMEEYADKYNGTSAMPAMSETPANAAPVSWDAGRVESEIQAADVYYKKWRETGDEQFKEMSADELGHANVILAYSPDLTQQQVTEFKQRIHWLMNQMAIPQLPLTPTKAPAVTTVPPKTP
jgi:hypothetical protein